MDVTGATTLEEAMRLAVTQAEQAKPRPSDQLVYGADSVQIQARIPKNLGSQLAAYCSQHDTTTSEVVRASLWVYINSTPSCQYPASTAD